MAVTVERALGRLAHASKASSTKSQRIPSPIFIRTASTTSTYPFPKGGQPSPYQIFHLPHSATQDDIKQRYYELVRLYHPDAPHAREREPNADTRHARFRAITAAYDKLKSGLEPGAGTAGGSGLTEEQKQRERQRWQRPRAASYDSRSAFGERSTLDEKWMERLIVGGLGATLLIVIGQYVTVRRGPAEQILDSRHKKLTSWQERQRKLREQEQEQESRQA